MTIGTMSPIPNHAVDMGTKAALSCAAERESELNYRLAQTEARDRSPPFAIMYMCRRQTHLTHAQYAEHYRTTHYSLAIQMPRLLRYLQLPVIDPSGSQSWDSVSIYVYPSEADFGAATMTSTAQALFADTALFIDESTIQETFLKFDQEFIAGIPATRSWFAQGDL